MKKRIFVINGLSVLLTIFCLFFVSFSIVNSSSKQSAFKRAEDYSNLVTTYFNGNNIEQTVDYFSMLDDLRLTIYDSEFNFILDSKFKVDDGIDKTIIDESYVSYSTYFKSDMCYYTKYVNGYYVRVCIELTNINSFFSSYYFVGFTILLIIFVISVCLSIFVNKKTLNSIKNVISKLSSISGDDVHIKSEEDLYSNIDIIQNKISTRMLDLEKEKLKIEGILEASAEGVIVIDSNKNISLINQIALEIFNLKDVINESYFCLLKSSDLVESITSVFKGERIKRKEVFIDNNVYSLKIIKLNSEFIKGILIILNDITVEFNLTKVKKDFFQNASHELKSPLTSIIGYQQLIEQGIYETKEDIIDGVRDTIKQANRMNTLIIDMLELSQLESEYEEETTNVNVKLVVYEVIDSLKLFIEKRNINLIMNVEDCFKEINAKHIEQLVKNVIENGIKYNNENSDLEITLTNKCFIVKDYGIGIENKNKDRIFERFYRVSSNNQIRGNGLGLAIVKHIVNIYNYDINVDSVLTKYTEIKITF